MVNEVDEEFYAALLKTVQIVLFSIHLESLVAVYSVHFMCYMDWSIVMESLVFSTSLVSSHSSSPCSLPLSSSSSLTSCTFWVMLNALSTAHANTCCLII